MDNFKEASRIGLRFSTPKGVFAVEQLWNLTLADLAYCVRAVKKTLNKNEDDDLDFLESTTKVTDKTEELRFNILKEVYVSKKQEAEDKRTAKESKEFNSKILELIADKENESLRGKSIEELTAMLK
jgi:uncharacterized protein with von Willebrand factor type A (vWA) domain